MSNLVLDIASMPTRCGWSADDADPLGGKGACLKELKPIIQIIIFAVVYNKAFYNVFDAIFSFSLSSFSFFPYSFILHFYSRTAIVWKANKLSSDT